MKIWKTIHFFSTRKANHTQKPLEITLNLNAGLTQVLSDGTDSYLYGLGRIGEYQATWAYYLPDALGSVRQIVYPTSTVQLAQSLDPYGQLISTEGDEESNYGFTGEWTDATGLQHLRARYYNTNVGRFTTKDVWPVDYNQPMTLNGWMYVRGNPVNWVDPSGLCYVESPYGGYMVSGVCDAAQKGVVSVKKDDISKLKNSNVNVPLREKISREREEESRTLIVANPPGEFPTPNRTGANAIDSLIDQLTQSELSSYERKCIFQELCELSPNHPLCGGTTIGSYELASQYGGCLYCHANKESDHWLTSEELAEIDAQAREYLAYEGLLILSTFIPLVSEAALSLYYEAGLACLRSTICRVIIGAGGFGTEVLDDVKFPENPGQTGHIFRDAVGHLAEDSPANRQLLIDTVSPENFIETTEFGVDVYARLLENGTKVWVEVYNNVISNAGVVVP